MIDNTLLSALLAGVRRGDQEAAKKLLEVYSEPVRRFVRVQLRHSILRRRVDSVDICQSVFAEFFVRARLGLFEFEASEQLFGLLTVMARSKVTDKKRVHFAKRRDIRRTADENDSVVLATDAPPSEQIEHEELVLEFRNRMSDEERFIADQRLNGIEWQDLASAMGLTSSALRQRFTRAVNRISQELRV